MDLTGCDYFLQGVHYGLEKDGVSRRRQDQPSGDPISLFEQRDLRRRGTILP